MGRAVYEIQQIVDYRYPKKLPNLLLLLEAENQHCPCFREKIMIPNPFGKQSTLTNVVSFHLYNNPLKEIDQK